MSMFPGGDAVVYYNEAGEPLGWDYPGDDPPELDDELDLEDDDDHPLPTNDNPGKASA